MYKKDLKIHFIGIGGIGMSGIAEVLLNLGYQVSGSDLKPSKVTRRLSRLGAKICKGHRAENAEGADVVVYSSAVTQENAEVKSAITKKITLIPRAEMLAELMRMKYGIAVAGAHGKTTTTSLISQILAHAGFDPTVVIGGRLNSLGTNAKLGQGEFLVAEADESDGSFLSLTPSIAVITNIDREHLNYYGSLEKIKETFSDFINKVPFYGVSVICMDDENIQSIIPAIEKRLITYGLKGQADYTAASINFSGFKSEFDVIEHNNVIGRIKLKISGIHNICNSLAAIAVGIELGIKFDDIKKALEGFSGIERRFQVKGKRDGVTVVDDYGHHPTEIKATLKAARENWTGRIVALFQPHRYSRTQDLLEEFFKSFYDADLLILADIYAAGEKPIDGIDSDKLREGIMAHGHKNVSHIKERKDILKHLFKVTEKGDLLITLGAGDVYKIGEAFLKGRQS
ncbi:MAG: UDP-N-acetylmuramate--L-alanine ligase [Candidatus Schekmanbacteria bacterium RIFCSPHIGHO2_02_FULL_38_11]|uniref:UDP-N-acetylmuramate--L-alanine ligase n=1 Tax=Candidatus Schekmanbacteria bacterium RIFCSPLOWO2_12_FULL_38_15 TaxID=1817883 RepID=A0A1F7SH44_9BACT|nr:MAG: UDP-N-acetylmuramate--L-alanine ligase [Candidatus Schekmanbacteria bacterium GWA2_38_9]OGL49697.1 MAG: UDP-N-acetylmuramate--L-alanine ligase [Candidatus Schekmanbacteria bacterium RIFCSPLOWO2_02_FULL_38_14]OGL51052.1 MAG: UDP-N-acetylmuramate--L-alanine ligase [Candidatus Schekmanbacteria bacterium RIFCSPHIGHO2_02_FULL_38_11]OGL53051.1 MAG: UDP-N-acetylmuramate--L-alanine ligase [Candidatus Schekmanbacteria bacterium RIFCSPLOWO2_12_FULL_38_15]